MKYSKILMAALILLGANYSNSFAQVKSFEGSWTIDPSKSAFGGLNPDVAAPKDILVNLTKDSIAVTRKFKSSQSSYEVLKFNNLPIETMQDWNTLKLASVTTDKTNIFFKWKYEKDGNEWRFDRTEKWFLSADGKTLTVDRITTMIDKVDKVRAIYIKEQ